MDIIKQIETDEIKRLGREIPDFSAGDTVIVNVTVVEGDRKRVQQNIARVGEGKAGSAFFDAKRCDSFFCFFSNANHI